MGSVLMLLAELGFLNIFLGGGFRVEGSAGIYYYSDIPEWGALLSNIRNWWPQLWLDGLVSRVVLLPVHLQSQYSR